MERGFNTRAKMDEAHHQLVQAEEDLRNAEAEAAEDRARLQSGTTTAGVNPVIAAAIVARDQAELNLARTEVRAPVDGIVTQASRLQLGQMAIEGLPALTIVASKRVWVEANFKETELAKMLPGQRAEIRIDAYPDLKLNGHVESLGARSEEHTSEHQSPMRISYAVFCLKKKNNIQTLNNTHNLKTTEERRR